MSRARSKESVMKELGTALVLKLQVYLRALRTYQSNNAMVVRAREQLEETLLEHFKSNKAAVHLQFLEGETFINGDLLSVDFQAFLRAQEVTRLLRSFDVGEVIFHPHVGRNGLEQLAEAIYACMHKKEDTLPDQLDGINLRPLHAAGIGASGAEIHRVCVWLFGGLLTALDSLQELHDDGLTPAMMPFKRHLRLMAEIMAERPTVFQLLCARRPHNLDQGDSLHCTIRTVEAVGFGMSLGLSRAALMTLGLSSSLDRITAHQGSIEVFEMLAKFDTLGDMAPPVMMTLWDLELIRNGGKGGRLAQIIHVVDHYVTLSQSDSVDSVGAEVWSRLQRAVPSSRSLISAMQEWKGKVPIGSLLKHPDLGQALLLDLGGPDATPRLCRFNEWGILSEPVEGISIPSGAPSRFGRIHALHLPSDSAQAAAKAQTTPPFRVTDGSEETTLEPGSMFGGRDGKRFVVEALAGKGGQALVYKVRDTRLGRMAAAKLSTAHESSMRKLFLERFERELLLSSRVTHPHVLQVYDCGELSGGTPYVLLEWMDRGDLVELLDAAWAIQRNLPLSYIHYYGTAIAGAMRAVHLAQVIHRDIKPDNILVRVDGVAKLTDFGVAKDISEGAPELTEIGQTMGTLGFMAPEQLLGLPGPQSDIFSFGITMYRLICAKVPAQVMVNSIPVGRILEEAWGHVPESWVPLLQRLTAPDLEDRAESFDEVLELFHDMDSGELDNRELLQPSLLPPLPSAEFGAVGPPPPATIGRRIVSGRRGRGASGSDPNDPAADIGETVALETVEELMKYPGGFRGPMEDDDGVNDTAEMATTSDPDEIQDGTAGDAPDAT